MGIVVENMSAVMKLNSEKMKPPPKSGVTMNTDYLIDLVSVE
jgi:chemotaxis signal transduction protein